MKGRIPKDPAVRRRRHKASTAAVLDPEEGLTAPELPTRLFLGGAILENTKAWWEVIWKSPMSTRWLDADVEGLYLVAILRNKFFAEPTAQLAAEIRQQETRFGLDVLSRRRLDWRIGGAPAPEAPADEQEVQETDQTDYRAGLRAVK